MDNDLIFEEPHSKLVISKSDSYKDILITMVDKNEYKETTYWITKDQVKEIINFLNKQL